MYVRTYEVILSWQIHSWFMNLWFVLWFTTTDNCPIQINICTHISWYICYSRDSRLDTSSPFKTLNYGKGYWIISHCCHFWSLFGNSQNVYRTKILFLSPRSDVAGFWNLAMSSQNSMFVGVWFVRPWVLCFWCTYQINLTSGQNADDKMPLPKTPIQKMIAPKPQPPNT